MDTLTATTLIMGAGIITVLIHTAWQLDHDTHPRDPYTRGRTGHTDVHETTSPTDGSAYHRQTAAQAMQRLLHRKPEPPRGPPPPLHPQT